jgi:hypothetical protein
LKHSLKFWLSLIGLFLVITWLGARNLNADGVWYDEWWSMYNAGAGWFGEPLSPVDIWNRLATEDPWQLPGYPWMLSAWGNSVGWTEYTARTLSLVAGILAVAVTYRLALDISRHRIVAYGAAATLGGSTWLIYYLHEIRGYTIIVLLAALLLLLYLRIIKRPRGIVTYAAFLLTMVTLLYIHYFCALFVAVIGLWHLTGLPQGLRSRHWWLTLACFMIAGATLLPFLADVLYATSVTQTQNRAVLDPASLLSIVGDMVYAFGNTGVALVVLLAFFSLRSRSAWKFWLFMVILLALDMAGYYYLKVNEIRYSMAIMPIFALIMGFGVYELSKVRVRPALIASIWLISTVVVDQNFDVRSVLNRTQPQPVREMAQILTPRLQEGDVVLNILGAGNRPSLQLHPIVQYFDDWAPQVQVLEIETRHTVQNYVPRIREAVGNANRVWVTYDPRWISTEWSLLMYWLNEHNIYQCATITDTDDLHILAFGRLTDSAPIFTYGEGIQIQPIGTINAQDGTFSVWLGFNVPQNTPSGTYSVALHVENGAGQMNTQMDYALPEVGQSCRMVEIPLNQPLEDEYHLFTMVYGWQTGERLMGTTPDGENSDRPLMSIINP